jgi:hypothetical protein
MLPVDVAQGGKKVPGKQGQGAPSGGGPAAAQAAAGVAAARRGGAGGGPALGAGAPTGGNGGRLNPGPQRGQVGAGTSPRAALPRPDAGGRPGGPGGARGPQSPQGRPAPAGAAPGAPQGLQAAGTGTPQGFNDFTNDSGRQDTFGGGRQDTMGGNRGPVPPQPQQRPTNGEQGRRPQKPQLPPQGGPRAELPGGNPQPRVPSWSDDNAQPPVPRSSPDAPRGHEEPDATSRMPRIDDRQGPGATGEYPRPDYDAQRPGAGAPQGNSGQFVRPDVFGAPNPSASGQNPSASGQFNRQDPASTGQFPMPGYDGGSTGQYAAPGQDVQQNNTGQFPAPGHGERQGGGTGQFERPGTNGTRPQRPQRPQPRRRPALPQEPEALPPAGPGDGRTPLYDTLETNWFNQAQGGNGAQGEQAPQQPAQAPAAPQRPAAPAASASSSWRTTPNDELGRQAERVRQPTAGGVTVSGLPRRVPRANLVAGTAQQQQHQTGPQVSRAPDDVRGRLTNLRRGIQQGRQAGTGQTGSFPSPTHQQER